MHSQHETIELHGALFAPLLSPSDIRVAVQRMAQALDDIAVREDCIIVCVLKGAAILTADLMRTMTVDLQLLFVSASSYRGMTSSGEVTMDALGSVVRDKHILLIEDIIETGRTIAAIKSHFLAAGATGLTVATLLFKPEALITADVPHIIGFAIPPAFVVGYGMDYDELGRGLPGIYQLAHDAD